MTDDVLNKFSADAPELEGNCAPEQEREVVRSMLDDFFTLRLDGRGKEAPKAKKSNKSKTRKPKKEAGGSGKAKGVKEQETLLDTLKFTPTKSCDGFRIRLADPEILALGVHEFTIACAYNLRYGNPLRKYERADFDFERAGQRGQPRITARGASITLLGPNKINVRIDEPSFKVSITGFDVNRSILAVLAQEESNDA